MKPGPAFFFFFGGGAISVLGFIFLSPSCPSSEPDWECSIYRVDGHGARETVSRGCYF